MTPDETIHVLVVDDDEDLLETVGTMLRRHEDVVVTTESSVPDALDTFDETFVDCIVSDYDMPGMDGLDFLTAVRWHSTDVPFVVTTAHGNERVASEAVRSGATDYIVKEGQWIDDLYDHVRSAVEARAEGKLASATSRFQRAIEAIDGYSVVMLDREGHVLTWNDGATALTGRDATDVIGETVQGLFDDPGAVDAAMDRARERGDVDVSLSLARPGGTTVPVVGQFTDVPGPLAEPRYFAVVLHRPREAGG